MTDREDRPNTLPWPPIILAVSVVTAFLANTLAPLDTPVRPVWLGVVLVVIALMIDIMAMRTMNAANTTILPHRGSDALVTSGIFSWSRNPIYVANVLLIVALAPLMGSWWPIIIVPLSTFAMQELAIKREEAHLSARFGDEFNAYCKATRRWI